MIRLKGAREKGTMTFMECLGVSQVDSIEASLWRETLDWSLGSHNGAKLVGGMCHVNDCRQETTRLHTISCTKTGWSFLNYNRVLQHALARSLREIKVQFAVENTWSFRERPREQKGGLNPLHIDMPTEAEALFDNYPRRKNKTPLLDITIAHPCASSNLENAARHAGTHLTDAVKRKKNKDDGSYLSTHSLLLLAMSTCGEVDSNVHTFIKELAIKRVEHRSEIHSNGPQHLAGRK